MKFGATLSRRSVPQWRMYNLDYDEIKNLIKIQTSSPEGCTRAFEKNLLAVLDSELERIDEFVRSKAGEIERRISACQKTLKNLPREKGVDKSTPSKQFLKIEAEIDRISKDAQLLARFVSTQYTGFKKLIKKHAKWCLLSPTAPHSLSSRFLSHLETQHPFHRQVNFQHIMRQLSALYNVRLDPEETAKESQERTSLDQFVDDNVDLSTQSSVTYWVHNDNQVEIELFLLKYLTLQLPSSALPNKDIQRSTRTTYFDSSNWSVYSSIVPESPNQVVNVKVPQILWEENSRNKDVVIVIPHDDGYQYLPMKRKNLFIFLSSKQEELDLTSPEWAGNESPKEWTSTAREVHKHIRSSSLHPVVQVSADRISFIKTFRYATSQTTSRVYATMDRNIVSTRLSAQSDFLKPESIQEDPVKLEGYRNVFPHAVLQIRWDGDSPLWLEELNGSHLIERVNGFSVFAHSLAALVPFQLPKLPYWMPLLLKDIRKLQPVPTQTVRKRDSSSMFVTTDSKTMSSQEARASDGSRPTSPSITRMQNPPGKDDRSGYGSSSSSPTRYWSEFENPEHEPYTVPVNETSALLPWLRTRRRRDLERGQEVADESFLVRVYQKICGAVAFEMKSSADGFTTLFYEKDSREESVDDEVPYNSEDSSEDNVIAESSTQHNQHRLSRNSSIDSEGLSRSQLLNRGYFLCVVGCCLLLSLFGIIGIIFNSGAVGVTVVFIGFLIALTLEIVSLVRFVMQGGNSGVAWVGFLVVILAGATFAPLVALAEEG